MRANLLFLALIIQASASTGRAFEALDVLVCAKQVGIITKGELTSCFHVNESVPGEFQLHEIHGDKCEGDPATSPVRAFFAVDKGVLTYEDIVTGSNKPCP